MDFKIKEARESAGYSQKALAEIIGVKANTFHGYESGKHDPKSELLIEIAKACNVTVDFLLGLEDAQKKSPAPDTSGAEEISIKESNDLLVALGYIEPGEQISDEDLAFLEHIIGLLDAWFSKGN